MDDATILQKLRSNVATEQSEAMRQLFPYPAMLLCARENGMGVAASTQKPDPSLFTTLLWAAQRFGKAFGLELNWVQQAPDPNAIVIPDSLPPNL